MADPVTFKLEIKGIEELKNKFSALDTELEKILVEATAAGAAVVVREAAINARKGGDEFPHRITGNLIRSITIIRKKPSPGKIEMQIGSDMDYACRLEYGFNDTDKKGRRYHQRPRPFLRPALDENKEDIQEEFNARIRQALGGLR